MQDSDEIRWNEANAIFDKVVQAYDREKYNSCLKLLARLRAEFEDLVNIWNIDMWEGLCSYQKDEFQEAKIPLEKAVVEVRTLEGEEPCLFSALNALGISNFFLGNYFESTMQLSEALSLVPNRKNEVYKYLDDVTIFWAHYYNGRSLGMLRRDSEALKALLKAKPKLTRSRQFKEYSNTKKSLAQVEYQIARVYYLMCEFRKARKHLESVQVGNLPEESRSFYFSCLGSNYYYERNYKSSLKAYNKLLKIGIPEWSEDRVFFEMGYCYFRTSDLKKAQKFFNKSLESEAVRPEFHGFAKRGLEEVKKALKS